MILFTPRTHRGIIEPGEGWRNEPHELGSCPRRYSAALPLVRCAPEGGLAADFGLVAHDYAAYLGFGHGRFPPGSRGHRRNRLHPDAACAGRSLRCPYLFYCHANAGRHSHARRSADARFRQALRARHTPTRISLGFGHGFGQVSSPEIEQARSLRMTAIASCREGMPAAASKRRQRFLKRSAPRLLLVRLYQEGAPFGTVVGHDRLEPRQGL